MNKQTPLRKIKSGLERWLSNWEYVLLWRGPKFSAPLFDDSQPCVTPAPEDPMPPSSFVSTCAHTYYSHIHLIYLKSLNKEKRTSYTRIAVTVRNKTHEMGVSFTLPEHIESIVIYIHNYIYIITIDDIYYYYVKGMLFMPILNYNYNKTIYNVFSLWERISSSMQQLKEEDISLWQHKNKSFSFWKTYYF